MERRVRCACGGDPRCELCNGTKTYGYTPGPRGWLPFACPTCAGTGKLGAEACPTCRGEGQVDPADPPVNGFLDVVWKVLFGA